MFSYNFHSLFSLETNIPYFEGMMHAFESNLKADQAFQFFLDDSLKIPTGGKSKVNLMLYHNPRDDSIEFSYPWLRPILAKLRVENEMSTCTFRFNRYYLRLSGVVAEGWELIDVFRSLLLTSLIQRGMYMIHGAAVIVNGECVLMPSFGNTGKTSTSWMLAKRGADFLTDEFAILDDSANCYGFPCSSLLSSDAASHFKLNLTVREKLSLRLNDAKSKILSTRFAPGGVKAYPDKIFKLSDKAKVSKIVFIQNGMDFVKKIGAGEAIARIRAVQNYELNWRANPYLIAYSFFGPRIDFSKLSTMEDDFLRSLVSRVNETYVVSSSSASHYRMIEDLAKVESIPVAQAA